MALLCRILLLSTAVLAFPALAQSQTAIAYQSPGAAYRALSKNPAAQLKRSAEGLEIVTVPEGPDEGIWVFAPNSHPTFPSVVKRRIIERDGQLFLDMDVLCGGTKPACDQYVAEFQKWNAQLAKELNDEREKRAAK